MVSKIKKIAVLGGAGLIGSYLTELLVSKGHKVVVIDDFSKGKKREVFLIGPKFLGYALIWMILVHCES